MKIIYGNKGFSLIEVLIAILILTISLFAIIPLLFTAVNVDNDTLMKVSAQKMMTDTIDGLMAETFCSQNSCTLGTCTNNTCPGTWTDAQSIDGNPINRTWTIANMPALPSALTPAPPAMKLITVTVTYTQGGENKTLMTQARKGY